MSSLVNMTDVVACDIIIAIAERVKAIEEGIFKPAGITFGGKSKEKPEEKLEGPFPDLQVFCQTLLKLISVISANGIRELSFQPDEEKKKFREAIELAYPKHNIQGVNIPKLLLTLLQ